MMLKDFDICPALCRCVLLSRAVYSCAGYITKISNAILLIYSKKQLLDFCKDIMTTSSSRSGGGSGSGSFDAGTVGDGDEGSIHTFTSSRVPWDEKKNRLCFIDYKKVCLFLLCVLVEGVLSFVV